MTATLTAQYLIVWLESLCENTQVDWSHRDLSRVSPTYWLKSNRIFWRNRLESNRVKEKSSPTRVITAQPKSYRLLLIYIVLHSLTCMCKSSPNNIRWLKIENFSMLLYHFNFNRKQLHVNVSYTTNYWELTTVFQIEWISFKSLYLSNKTNYDDGRLVIMIYTPVSKICWFFFFCNS